MASDGLMNANLLRVSWAMDLLVALGYILAVFYGGTRAQGPTLPVNVPGSDKVLHFVVFGGMTILVWRALRPIVAEWRLTQQLLLAGGISSGLGALLEIVQLMTPPRSSDSWDWVADILGIVLAGVATRGVLGRLAARGA
jgi:VanZ family protein